MVINSNDKVKNLLIIGNGFDLVRDLKTTFNSYIKENEDEQFIEERNNFNDFLDSFHRLYESGSFLYGKYDELKMFARESSNIIEFKKLSFWDIYILTTKFICSKNNKIINDNWSNIEQLIKDFFTSKNKFLTDKETNIYEMIDTKNNSLTFNKLLISYLNKPDGYLKEINHLEQTKDSFSNPLNPYKDKPVFENDDFEFKLNVIRFATVFLNENKNYNYYDLLLKELNKFEHNFSEYLLSTLKDHNYIDDTRTKLINNIISPTDAHRDKFNLLDFNYDNFKSEYVKKINHIHGSIKTSDKKPIIIGFDSSEVSPDKPYYRFTKASRIMEQSNIKSESILGKNIKNIYFYGHSLADADNSYFNAIFDYYDLYNKDINLIFCYTPYGKTTEENEKIKSNQMNAINNLIFNYGNTLNNTHGKNILPKLLLENRLHLKEVDKPI